MAAPPTLAAKLEIEVRMKLMFVFLHAPMCVCVCVLGVHAMHAYDFCVLARCLLV